MLPLLYFLAKVPFREGDVVKARVVSVDIEKQRILLTLREEDEAIVTRTAQPVQNEKVQYEMPPQLTNF